MVKSYSKKKHESKKKLKKMMKEIDCFWFFTVPVEREKKGYDTIPEFYAYLNPG